MNARRIVAVLSVVAVVAAVAIYVFRNGTQAAATPANASPSAAATPEINLPATLQAVTTVPVSVPIAGKIEAFQVEVGAEVYEGQLLAQIRSGGLESAREAAELDLERAETRVRNLETAISAARLEASRASADASRARDDLERASKHLQRQKMLYSEGATPRNTFEKAEKDFHALEADSKNLDAVAAAAEERITSLQLELDNARKVLDGKSQDLEGTRGRIGAGDVLSPVNGIVIARRGQEGDDVHPTMADLFQIASDLSTMYAVADAAAADIVRLQQGQPAHVTIAEMGGETLEGVIAKVENGKITVQFANPNPEIKPGLSAQIRIKLT